MVGNQKRDALISNGKIPGIGKHPISKKAKGKIENPSKEIVKLENEQIKQLIGKGNFPIFMNLTAPYFKLEDDSFLLNCSNLKELDLSGNRLQKCLHLSGLSKLKRLKIENNQLTTINLKGLVSLEFLSLANNKLDKIPDCFDLKKLIYFDLSGNQITGGFSEFSKLKSLKVLDLSNNNITYVIHEFYNFILVHVKKLTKLEFLSFEGNPIENTIGQLKFFVIYDMAKLKYFDWEPITKEQRVKAACLENEGAFDAHLVPIKSSDSSKTEDKLAPSLEVLLNEKDETPTRARSRTLDVILGENDPLDDILKQLHSSGTRRVEEDDNSFNDSLLDEPPFPDQIGSANLDASSEGKQAIDDAPPMPAEDDDTRALSQKDIDYSDLLNDMLKSDPRLSIPKVDSTNKSSEKRESSLNYLEMLYAMLTNDTPDTNTNLDNNDEEEKLANKTGLATAKKQFRQSRGNREPPKKTVSYLDMLEEMIDLDSSKGSIRNKNLRKSPLDEPEKPKEEKVKEEKKPKEEEVKSKEPEKPKEPEKSKQQKKPKEEIKSNEPEKPKQQAKPKEEIKSNEPEKPKEGIKSNEPEKPKEEVKSKESETPKVEEKDFSFDYEWESRPSEIYLNQILKNFSDSWNQVYSCSQPWRGQEITFTKIQLLDNNLNASSEYLKQETSSLIKIDHPNLLPTIGICSVEPLGIIHPFYPERTLSDFINDKSKPLPLENIIEISQCIASAMITLHSSNISHGSLTPKNILVTKDKYIIRNVGYSKLKFSQLSKASEPAYLAPELLSSSATLLNEKTDVYSFGILFWQLFTRMAPYPQLTFNDLRAHLVEKESKLPLPECPFVCTKLMEVCMSFEAEFRPSFLTISKILAKPLNVLLEYAPKQTPTSQGKVYQPPQTETKVQTPIYRIASTGESKLRIALQKIKDLIRTPSDIAPVRGCDTLIQIAQQDQTISEIISCGLVNDLVFLFNSKHETVKEYALRSCVTLAEHDEFAQAFCSNNGIPQLLKFLVNKNPVIALHSTKIVTKLAKHSHSKDLIREGGGISKLTEILKEDTNEYLSLQTVWALALLLENDPFGQEEFISIGGLSPLLRLMSSSSPALQIRVLNALASLILNPKVQDRILKAGVVTQFLGLLNSDSPLLRLLAIKTIDQFSEDPKICEELIQHNLIQTLCSILSSNPNDQFLSHCLKTLIALTIHEQQNTTFSKMGGLLLVIKFLNWGNEDVRLRGILLIANLLCVDINRTEFLKNRGLELCISALQVNNSSIQDAVLSILEPFAFYQENWPRFADGLPKLLSLLNSPQTSIKRKSIKIISEILRLDSSKVLLCEKKGIPLIIQMFRSSDEESQESSAFALAYISDNPQCRAAIAEQGFSQMLPMLKSSNLHTQEQTLIALGKFAADPLYADNLIQNALKNVITCLSSPQTNIQSQALKVILVLTKHGSLRSKIAGVGLTSTLVSALTTLTSSSSKSLSNASQKLLPIIN